MKTLAALLLLTSSALAADQPKLAWKPATPKGTWTAARENYVTRTMIDRQQQTDRRIREFERRDAYQFRYGRFGN
jgi:hypothetical protein